MLRLHIAAAIALLLSSTATSTQAMRGDYAPRHETRHARTIVIKNDRGGMVGEYNKKLETYRANGAHVEIAGKCISACARFMILPDVCARRGAKFMFHAIFDENDLEVRPDESMADSKATDTPAAYALEEKYDTFHMGFSDTRPYARRQVEPGVAIVYDDVYLHGTSGASAYQEFLEVDAALLIPRCRSGVTHGVTRRR